MMPGVGVVRVCVVHYIQQEAYGFGAVLGVLAHSSLQGLCAGVVVVGVVEVVNY